MPPYVVFGDASLREMARLRPSSLMAFRAVRGVGEKKLADLGPMFVDAVTVYCGEHELECDAAESVRPAAPPHEIRQESGQET